MKYLLDTNALIHLRGAVHGRPPKNAADAERVARLRERTQRIPAADLAMSPIALGELRLWAEKHAQRDKAEALLTQLQAQVACTGLGADDAQGCHWAKHYGRARAHLEAQGQTIGGNDLWIAAHALALCATLVTHNTAEFQRVPGLRVEDWTQT
ncbi:MAG: PIN domain-containing protein [Thauera sp.]|nr:PIN domain-containing protein [Thauera sp.]